MLNYIWLGLVVAAVVIGGCTDHLKEVAEQSFKMAEAAVMDIALPLLGIMAMWLGVMRLAERAGLVALLARVMRPLMVWLFPEVPADHPAMGAMLLNMAASVLGLNNAATPLGLKAMKHLQTLNPRPGVATNAMCTYLAINTSSIQLIPATAIAVLATEHSSNPTAIVGTSIMATACAAVAAVAAAKFLERLPMYRLKPLPDRGSPSRGTPEESRALELSERPINGGTAATGTTDAQSPEASPVHEAAQLHPLAGWAVGVLAVFGVFFVYLFVRLTFPGELMWLDANFLKALHLPAFLGPRTLPESAHATLFIRIVDAVSALSIPFLLSVFPLYAALRGVKVYEDFVEGAKEGFDVSVKIIPYLVTILVAIGMFRGAGGIDILSRALGPTMNAVGFPAELLPMVLMRPLSGSGTLGMFKELVKRCGPDSLVSRMGGTIFGSTETTFYVLAVYFGSVGIKKTRYAVLAGLTADFVGVVASVIICKAVFG